MNFKEYIELHRASIYQKICQYVPIKEPIAHYAIMRDYIDRQGSYRRPGLVLLAGQMFGADLDELMLPAAAQQLSEDWILMQDDSEDDSELRRGKPAIQKIYGWVDSINSSEVGHMSMWRMLKDYMLKVGPEKGDKMYQKFYDMLEYTMEGQFIENTFIHKTKDLKKASEDLYFRIVDSKTCYYTVYGPLQIGAIGSGQNGKFLTALEDIGRPAGRAFQIVDDILDMVGDEKKFGKKNNGDLYEGKITLMVLHAYKNATSEEKAKFDSIYMKKRDEKNAQEIQFIVETINKYDGIGYAKQRAKAFGEEATAMIEKYRSILPNNEYTTIMLSAIEELYVRDK